MTLLIYSYKTALGDGVELQYSLRSIQANLHMPDLKVMLVGDEPPSWMRPDEFVVGNPTDDKVLNMGYNLRAACERLVEWGPSDEEVWYLSDDYFLLDAATSIAPTHRGHLSDHLAKCRRDLRAGHWYTKALSTTLEELQGERAMLLSYELHRPMPIQPDLFLEATDRMPDTVFWRTWYGNVAEVNAYFARDGRYVGKSLPQGVPWVSSEDRVWAEWMGRKIADMFPAASRWEARS